MDRMAWGENCVLRDDVRYGTLALAEFAADLNGVRTGDAAKRLSKTRICFFDAYLSH